MSAAISCGQRAFGRCLAGDKEALSGYKGRIALFEIMLMSDRIRDMIMDGASTQELQNAAREEGMQTLRDAGLIHIYDGVTTIEEVVKETIVS